MDTRMIDVAIGLALVFALTSLLVTALQEVYSSWTKMRGKVLYQAVVSFVGDDERFAKALLDHPLLVSLAPQTQQQRDLRRPSYIAADSVVSALVGHLVQMQGGGARPQTPLQLVDALKAPPPRGAAADPSALAGAEPAMPNALFVRGLSSLVIGVEQDWAAFETRLAAWYDSVATRSTGWFKRKTQAGVFVLGLLAAAAVNINPLVIATHLWKDEPLRKAVVGAAERISAAYAASAPASGAALQSPAAPAPAASAGGGERLPDGGTAAARLNARYDDFALARDRVFASLGAEARAALRPLLAADLAFDRELQAWRKAGAPAAQAPRVRDRAQALLSALPAAGADLDAPLRAMAAAADAAAGVASAPVAATVPAAAAAASGAASAAATRTATEQRRIAACAASSGTNQALNQMCVQLDELAGLQQAGLPIGWSRDDWSSDPGGWSFWYQVLLALAGWLLTALACTLGAPFWFDTLSKLIRLRGSGNAGTQAAGGDGAGGGTPSAASTMLARTPTTAAAPVAAAGGEAAGVMSDALNDAERRLTVAEVQRVQRGLPMPEIEVSGYFDGNTRRAIRAWQERQGLLPATGELSEAQIRDLLAMRTPGAAGAAPAPAGGAPQADEHLDGCDVPIAGATDDASLPPARGGVASQDGA